MACILLYGKGGRNVTISQEAFLYLGNLDLKITI
jgi:hypothetical protein